MLHILLLFLFAFSAGAIDWQGHRGARGLYPENTIGAMKEALKYPISTLEMDVVLSKDRKVVLSHEPWMNSEICLNPHGETIRGKEFKIPQLSYEEIKKFDCGSKRHPLFPSQLKIKTSKPLLGDLIKEIESEIQGRGLSIKYNIEIKSDDRSESDLVLIEILEKLPVDRFMIQSFNWEVLKYIHQKYPQVSLVALTEKTYNPQKVLAQLGFSPTVFSPHYKLIKASDITFFHQRNIKIIPWTVNDVDEMSKLLHMGVDGIITDYPNKILNLDKKQGYPRFGDCFPDENRFEGKCIKIPAHAMASPNIPGWVCKKGYVQKRLSCIKIQIPANGILTEDGKSWSCEEGFRRYRGRCRSI